MYVREGAMFNLFPILSGRAGSQRTGGSYAILRST